MLPAALDEESGWWNCPPSLSTLVQNDFLPYVVIQDMQDVWEARKEQTLALAKALQCCIEWAGGPHIVMCSVARDLQRCMAHLMEFKEEDVLEISSLKPMYGDSTASPTPLEEAALLEEHQVAGGSGEQAPKPEDVTELEEITIGSQALWRCPPPLPGFKMLQSESGSPLLEDMLPLVGIPKGAWLDLTSISTLQMAYFRSELTGTLEYWYEMQVTGSLCMGLPDTLGLPDTKQEITELWIECATCSEWRSLPICEWRKKPAQELSWTSQEKLCQVSYQFKIDPDLQNWSRPSKPIQTFQHRSRPSKPIQTL